MPPPTLTPADHARFAAELRRLAEWHEAHAAGPAATVRAGVMVAANCGVLGDTPAACAAYIDAHPGSVGRQIAVAAGCSHDHFRGPVMRKLRTRGYFNVKGGGGYYPPGWRSTAGDVVVPPHHNNTTTTSHTRATRHASMPASEG